MRHRIRLWLALMAAGLGLAALGAASPRPETPPQAPAGATTAQGTAAVAPLVPDGTAPDLAILYTGSVVGLVEPCGCPHNPAGGLGRRAGYVLLFKQKYPGTPISLVESGDFSGDPTEAGRVKTRNLLEGMSMMEYDALNLGERELAGGLEEFERQTEGYKLPFISANLVDRVSGEGYRAPFVIRKVKLASGREVKIGYLGLNALNTSFVKEAGGRVVIMKDPVEAARRFAPDLRSRVDLLVVLATMGRRELTTVLEAVPGIDLVLASEGSVLSAGSTLEKIGGVPVFYSGDQGKRVSEVRVTFGAKGEAPAMTGFQILLTKEFPSEPKLQALIDTTIAKVNEINRQAAAAIPAAIAPVGRMEAPAEGASSLPGGPKPYLGADVCATCHPSEHDGYMKSAHAHALATLAAQKQDYNPDCVKCHVTGFGKPDGFVNVRQTPQLAGVQCEACHGSAFEHVQDPQRPFGNVPPRDCFTCHTKENSPDFVFFKYWQMIKH